MDVQLTEQQMMLQKTVREFCEREVLPVANEYSAQERFPEEVIRKLGQMGVPGILFPAAYGGSDGDPISFLVALEELARADASVALTVEVAASLCGELLYRYGTEEQKRRWLVPTAKGETIGAFALTEPEAGSDAANIATRAVREDDEWVINGSKAFISNTGTPMTGFAIVAAVTSQDRQGKKAISNIIVPSDAPGFSAGPAYHKLGWRASATHPLYFEDCRVPATNLLGAEGRGLAQFLWSLDIARVAIAAMGVGLMQACLEMSVDYAQKRRAFGKSLSEFQGIQFKLADMATAVHVGRLATLHAGALWQQGLPFKKEASMAKLFTSEAALRVVDEALQVHGGYGYMEEGPVARYYRDAKILTIGEGTSEVQRMIIARELGRG